MPLLRWFGRPAGIAVLAAMVFGLAAYALLPSGRMTGVNDFVHFYIGGALYGTPDIHSVEANRAKQRELIGVELENSFFGRPTFYGFFLKPLSWLPYPAAYAVFQLASVAAFIVFLRFAVPPFPKLGVTAAFSLPLVSNFANGQDVAFLLLFCTLSLMLAEKKRDIPSGLCVAMCAIKLHLFAFVPLAALMHRRRRIFLGGVLGGLVLTALSLAGGGIEVQRQLLKEMRDPNHSPNGLLMPNLRSLAGDNGTWFAVLAVFATALVIWLMWKSADYVVAFGWSLIGGLLVNVHAYLHDCLLVLLAIALLHRHIHKVTLNILLFSALPLACLFQVAQVPFAGIVPALLLGALCVESGAVAFSGAGMLGFKRPLGAPLGVGADDRT